jgi:hypothetical protein
MPYTLSGNSVMVKRRNKWVVLKVHPTRAKAQAHLRALQAKYPR